MARPKLRSPSQSVPVRWALAVYEFLASLQLAVVLIFLSAAVLGWGTFIEKWYGTPAVQFGVYGTWWFVLLNVMLAVNIFCAAAIRYPWKRYQTGFVITHIGLLTLLAGCLISRISGIDAQMPILEGDSGNVAFEDAHHFHLDVISHQPKPGEKIGGNQPIDIPFKAGPFNWSDYSNRWLPSLWPAKAQPGTAAPLELMWLPWGLPHRDRGVIYDKDGIRLEVLDYYSDSQRQFAPQVNLLMSGVFQSGPEKGKEMGGSPLRLSVPSQKKGPSNVDPPSRQAIGGGLITFYQAKSQAEAEAFKNSAPDPKLGFGDKGQVVLIVGSQRFPFLVGEKIGKGKFPLGNTGLNAELVEYVDHVREVPVNAARIEITRTLEDRKFEPRTVLLMAEYPEMSVHDADDGVYGAYWVPGKVESAADRMMGKAGARIDVLATPGGKLLYRRWQPPQLTVGDLPLDGQPVDAFEMPAVKTQLRVTDFLPAETPDYIVTPLPFDKKKNDSLKRRSVKLRMTLDDNTKVFWLTGLPPEPGERILQPGEQVAMGGKGRSVAITMPPDGVDIGFQVKLLDFERRLDPGTNQPSHYSSDVEFYSLDGKKKLLDQPVNISMNAPVDISSPTNGRSYRLFQESFMGPWNPGEPLYERHAARIKRRPPQLEGSVLTVNYDPGRSVKYMGSLLIVAGIFTMFYMRAYFFKPKLRAPAHNVVHADASSPPREHEPVA